MEEDILSIFNDGARYFNDGRYDEALLCFYKCVECGDDEAIFNYGQTLYCLGKYLEAFSVFKRIYPSVKAAMPYAVSLIDRVDVDFLSKNKSWFHCLLRKDELDYCGLKGLERLHRLPVRHPDSLLADHVALYTSENQPRWWLPPLGNPADIVCAAMMAGRSFEPAVEEAVARLARPGDLVIDGGANFGQVTLACAHAVGSGGQVLAFEADPFVARVLVENMRENNADPVIVVQAAMWDQDGETLYFPPWNPDVTPSLGSRHLDPTLTFGDVPILTRTLDAVLREHASDRRVSLIKLDIQGAELRALQGSVECLRRWRPALIVELDPSCMPLFGYVSEDVESFLRDFGYNCSTRLDALNWLVEAKDS